MFWSGLLIRSLLRRISDWRWMDDVRRADHHPRLSPFIFGRAEIVTEPDGEQNDVAITNCCQNPRITLLHYVVRVTLVVG